MPEQSAIRPGIEGDLEAVAAIYNEGIADRVATFETVLIEWLLAEAVK